MYERSMGRLGRVGRVRVRQPGLAAASPIRHLDLTLVLVALALTAFGNLMVYSASRVRLEADGLPPRFLLDRQLMFSVVGFGLMILMASFSYRRLKAFGPIMYVAGLFLLGLVLTPFGQAAAGAQRWISVGFFQFQPSEFMKIAVLITLALALTDRRGAEPGWGEAVRAIVLVGVPALFIYVQPDLGTLLVFVAISIGMLVVAGTRARVLLVLLIAGIIGVIGVLQLGVLKDYQVARLTGFLDTSADIQGTGYNLNQARIAVGSGRVTGKGLFSGTQTNLDFVPEVHTDFIFTAVAEELGFVGALALLGLFALLLWRGLRIAMLAKDRFGTLLAAGVVSMLAFQMFVNIGMTIGVSPITGIPLPFVSYGGSHLITTFVLTGILLNVHMRRI